MATTTIRGFIKKVAWGLFGNGSVIDANAITRPFVIANGWDSNKTNFPSGFNNSFGTVLSIPFWADYTGQSTASQVQVLIDENGKTYVRRNENSTWSSWVPQVQSVAVTLAVADWANDSQTVTVTGVTANSDVVISPVPTSASDYTSAGIMCTAQASNSLTFTCTTTPSAAISVNLLVFS